MLTVFMDCLTIKNLFPMAHTAQYKTKHFCVFVCICASVCVCGIAGMSVSTANDLWLDMMAPPVEAKPGQKRLANKAHKKTSTGKKKKIRSDHLLLTLRFWAAKKNK